MFAAVHDIGFRTIPNRVSAGLLLIGLAMRAWHGDLIAGCACGAVMFAFTYFFWRRGWMGGADVKLLTAAAVFVPPLVVPTLVVGTSMAGGVLALVYVVASRLVPRSAFAVLHRATGAPPGLLLRATRCELRRLSRRGPLPYAAAIATGSWLAIAAS